MKQLYQPKTNKPETANACLNGKRLLKKKNLKSSSVRFFWSSGTIGELNSSASERYLQTYKNFP